MLAAEGLLGHQHANSGWGTFDDDNMVGATAFMETLELALELRRANYGAKGEQLGLRPLPVHRGRGRGGEAVGAAVELHRLGRGEDRRGGAARGAERARTPSGPTSWSTPRSVPRAFDELASLTARLVEIDSINPDLIPGGAGEGEIAAFVADWLRAAGLEVELYEAAPGTSQRRRRGARYGRRPLAAPERAHGHGRRRRDGEPVRAGGAGRPPPRPRGRRHEGIARGVDARRRRRGREGFSGDVIVAAVADEEVGSLGTEALVRSYDGRRRDRDRADRGGRCDRAQGLRRVRGRDGGIRRARLATRPGHRRDRGDGPDALGDRRASMPACARATATRCSEPGRSMPR